MQFGCLASEEIIQVSDHPVAPSVGTNPVSGPGALTGWLSASNVKYWYCHVVPTWSSPLVNRLICFRYEDQ